MGSRLKTGNKLSTWLFYLVMVAAAIGLFVLINDEGKKLVPLSGVLPQDGAVAHAQINYLLQVLLALSVVIVMARAMGSLFALIGQPSVIGEVVGGILLGPSFLGSISPELYHTRGLVELIVLNLGLDLKIIPPQLFAMMVIMALVTTFATSPILHLLIRNHPWDQRSQPG